MRRKGEIFVYGCVIQSNPAVDVPFQYDSLGFSFIPCPTQNFRFAQFYLTRTRFLCMAVSHRQTLRSTYLSVRLPCVFLVPCYTQNFRFAWYNLLKKDGGDEENRTPDPLLARQVLSQLSYAPVTSKARSSRLASSFSSDASST